LRRRVFCLLGNSWVCFRILREHGYEGAWMPLQSIMNHSGSKPPWSGPGLGSSGGGGRDARRKAQALDDDLLVQGLSVFLLCQGVHGARH